MRHYVLALALVLGTSGLSGCGPSLRDEAPAHSWVAKRSFERSIACVAEALDRSFGVTSPLGKPIAHRIVVQEPDVIVKIEPEATVSQGPLGRHKPYRVRLMVLAQYETVIDLYSYPEWDGLVLEALRPCM
ncbi:hypothetical protein [Rhodoligotrophos defluvii]|uniref:hypothetical protein n=1 Tax=Rhodoligotrophos defluvii TaxID=2561934 RepID=UPI0010C98C4A|nr:hypothetical protein [Rhodoligotrophos defluvii]